MIDRVSLLRDLQQQVTLIEDDLAALVEADGGIRAGLRAEHTDARAAGRTAATWQVWRDERITQAAVAWVLGCVFVRFCEDNDLLDEVYLAGSTPEAMILARKSHQRFLQDYPAETDRGWLHTAFDAIAAIPAWAILFRRTRNPLFALPLSPPAATVLLEFWRQTDSSGRLVHDFTDRSWDTEFLGDLYEDLSASARKRYGLARTPQKVDDLVLDHTLTPAIEEFGYRAVRMVDPACGSGQFLLGAFHRVLAAAERDQPDADVDARVRLALDAVHGVDLNPFAVVIARFRLLVAALRATGGSTLRDAVRCRFALHVAVGDSLAREPGFAYRTEDLGDHPGILDENRYHVVVGHPPHTTAKDAAARRVYREAYDLYEGSYPLSVPFVERLFSLARPSPRSRRAAGHVGAVTVGTFTTRAYGKKLVERFLADQVDLTAVVDVAAALMPGRDVATLLLLGRRRKPTRTGRIRTVRGEPHVPRDAYLDTVWTALLERFDGPPYADEWVTVGDVPRAALATHPWPL